MNPVVNQTPELSDEFVDRHAKVLEMSENKIDDHNFRANQSYKMPQRFAHDIDLINQAFKKMRSQGMIAVQNYGWSSGEGGGMIGDRLDEKFEQGKKLPIGVAWYSTQAGDNRNTNRTFFINFDDGHAPDDPDKECPYTQTEVGVIVCEILIELGIAFEWNGKPSRAIGIYPFDTQDLEYVAKVEATLIERDRKWKEDTLRAKIWRLENEIAKAKKELKGVIQ